MHEPDFYIGYQPAAPRRLAKFMKRIVIAVVCGALTIAGVLVTGLDRELPKTFEYESVRHWTGTLVAQPVPMLVEKAGSGYVLVSSGKHGFEQRDLRGQPVSLRGTFIGFGANRMLEVVVPPRPAPGAATQGPLAHLGRFTLEGEVVDTKCYFGVMQPGAGKVHRDCAARCISGGIPPGLLVRDADRRLEVVLLAATDPVRLRRRLVPFAGDRVRVAGHLSRGPVGLVLQTSLEEEQPPWNIRNQP